MVSHLSLGAGSTRVAPGFAAPSCGFADCVVAAEASWWGVWEVAFAEQVSIQQAAPNIFCWMLHGANRGLIHNHQ